MDFEDDEGVLFCVILCEVLLLMSESFKKDILVLWGGICNKRCLKVE